MSLLTKSYDKDGIKILLEKFDSEHHKNFDVFTKHLGGTRTVTYIKNREKNLKRNLTNDELSKEVNKFVSKLNEPDAFITANNLDILSKMAEGSQVLSDLKVILKDLDNSIEPDNFSKDVFATKLDNTIRAIGKTLSSQNGGLKILMQTAQALLSEVEVAYNINKNDSPLSPFLVTSTGHGMNKDTSYNRVAWLPNALIRDTRGYIYKEGKVLGYKDLSVVTDFQELKMEDGTVYLKGVIDKPKQIAQGGVAQITGFKSTKDPVKYIEQVANPPLPTDTSQVLEARTSRLKQKLNSACFKIGGTRENTVLDIKNQGRNFSNITTNATTLILIEVTKMVREHFRVDAKLLLSAVKAGEWFTHPADYGFLLQALLRNMGKPAIQMRNALSNYDLRVAFEKALGLTKEIPWYPTTALISERSSVYGSEFDSQLHTFEMDNIINEETSARNLFSEHEKVEQSMNFTKGDPSQSQGSRRDSRQDYSRRGNDPFFHQRNSGNYRRNRSKSQRRRDYSPPSDDGSILYNRGPHRNRGRGNFRGTFRGTNGRDYYGNEYIPPIFPPNPPDSHESILPFTNEKLKLEDDVNLSSHSQDESTVKSEEVIVLEDK